MKRTLTIQSCISSLYLDNKAAARVVADFQVQVNKLVLQTATKLTNKLTNYNDDNTIKPSK